MPAQRTMAWSLTLLFVALVVYASLYPFTGWRWPTVAWWGFVVAPWPRYWTAFDLLVNIVGYVPLGWLLGMVVVRQRRNLQRHWWLATLTPMLLSFVLESLQTCLPSRVASNVDWVLNSVGGAVGVSSAWVLHHLGWLTRWSRWRRTWWTNDAYGALVLLGIWPMALLYPTSMPFALGHLSPHVLHGLQKMWNDAPPWLQAWTPSPFVGPMPIAPWPMPMQITVVALGILIPILLGYQVLRRGTLRKWWLLVVVWGAVVVESLSSGLTYGPHHVAAWWTEAVGWGLVAALVVGALAQRINRLMLNWVLLAGLLLSASLLNSSAQPPYFHESLEIWTQGRFIHFYGATQWLGWLWPYAVLLHVLRSFRRLPALQV